jgi:hypothetical protein
MAELSPEVIKAAYAKGAGTIGSIMEEIEAKDISIKDLTNPVLQLQDPLELFTMTYLINRIHQEGKKIYSSSVNSAREDAMIDRRAARFGKDLMLLKDFYRDLNYKNIVEALDDYLINDSFKMLDKSRSWLGKRRRRSAFNYNDVQYIPLEISEELPAMLKLVRSVAKKLAV